MASLLRGSALRVVLESLITTHRPKQIVAANEACVASWAVNEFEYSTLAHMARGGTDPPAALRSGSLDPAVTAVITDSEGAEQLRREDMSPLELVVLSE